MCWPTMASLDYKNKFISENKIKNSSQMYIFIVDTPYFMWVNKNKLLFDFQMFLFDPLL